MPDTKLLILNCGSSSIKCKLVVMPEYRALAEVDISRIGLEYSELRIYHHGEEQVGKEKIPNHEDGIQKILELLMGTMQYSKEDIRIVGHRVVHGGEKKASAFVDEKLLEYLTEISELAPLHNPAHIAGMKACGSILPHAKQVAVFDNGYHQTLSRAVTSYAIPYALAEKCKIRKYGFHGIAFRSMLEGSKRILKEDLKDKKTILLMLGSGTTANACVNGISYDVSAGFTPHEGLIQSTRSGDIDAAVYTFLMKKEGYTPDMVDDLMNRKGGWSGMSGISSDLREIYDAARKGDDRAQNAIDALCHRIKKYVGAYAAVLGGLDLLVFGGGVGEHAWYVREQVCRGLEFLGVELEEEINRTKKDPGVISVDHGRVKVLVTHVEEEEIIARDAFTMSQDSPSPPLQ